MEEVILIKLTDKLYCIEIFNLILFSITFAGIFLATNIVVLYICVFGFILSTWIEYFIQKKKETKKE